MKLDDLAERGFGGGQKRRFRRHLNRFRYIADLELNVKFDHVVDADLNVLANELIETGVFGRDRIDARRKVGQCVITGFV